jgi:hypothetical protein
MGILALAKQRGFSSDRSAISPHVVPQKLRPNSQLFYDRDLDLWDELVDNDMVYIEHLI